MLRQGPTSDRLRETLFNILAPKITQKTRFLDLCAGTGAVGIEALSRGAAFSTFVDRSRKACGLIERNLDSLEIPEDRTEVVCESAERFLLREHGTFWNVIFYDPPYGGDYSLVLKTLDANKMGGIEESGVLIAEHHSKTILPDQIGEMRRWRILKQGESRLSFFEKA